MRGDGARPGGGRLPPGIVYDEIDKYMDGLANRGDAALVTVEKQGLKEGWPIVGAAEGSLLHILARSLRAKRILELGTAIGYSGTWLARAPVDEGASEPGPRIPDRGAELQDALRAQGPREDVEETPLRRTDDRPALLQALLLDRHEGGIAAVRQAIHVLVNFVVYNAGGQSTTARPSAVPTHEPSRVVDKRLSGGGPHRSAGWDPCASSRRRTAPSCRGISRRNT